MKRIEQAFQRAKQESRAAFIPYLTAGFPNEKGFLDHALELLKVADLLEIGLPYSDPLGDGPTIQQASEKVLVQGMTTEKTFSLIKALRQETDKPLILMSYYNPIYCYHSGEAGFLQALKQAGADGIILPDLPPEEAHSLRPLAETQGIDTIFLVAPTSTEERLKKVTEACHGFVYAVSVTGVTGARNELPKDLPHLVSRIKAISPLPVAVGFGVSGSETAQTVASVADGVVVGSALIRSIQETNSLADLAKEIAQACGLRIDNADHVS